MSAGQFTFVIDVPPHFQRDVTAGCRPAIQINADATAMVQAGLGPGYAQSIVPTEIGNCLSHVEGTPLSPVNLVVHMAFNPNAVTAWFTSVMGIIGNLTLLAILPLKPLEIAAAKTRANGLVIIAAVGLSLYIVVRMTLGVPVAGSIPLFMAGWRSTCFSQRPFGIFGLLFMLVFLPMSLLSGSNAPLESMPSWLATAMQA